MNIRRSLFALAFLVMGLVAVGGGGYHGYSIVTEFVLEDSVEVQAEIVSSEAVWIEANPDTHTDVYRVEVTYRYTYQGTEYTNDNVVAGNARKQVTVENEAELQEKMKAYEEGTTMTAHVNPNDPSEAYLHGPNVLLELLKTAFFLVAGGVFALGGFMGLVGSVLGLEESDDATDDGESSGDGTGEGDDTDGDEWGHESQESSWGDDPASDAAEDTGVDDTTTPEE